MSQILYPVATDITNRLADARIDTNAYPSATSINRALAAAVREWKELCGWPTFLNSTSAVTTRYFDPPGPRQPRGLWGNHGGGYVLDLEGGLISLTSLSVMGSVWVQGDPSNPGSGQFWLEPYDAQYDADDPRPYTEVEFRLAPWGDFKGIAIAGVWGYCTSLPEDVFDAITAWTCYKLTPEVASGVAGGRAQRKEGLLEERYAVGRDAGPYAFESGLWQKTWLAALYTHSVKTYGE